MKNKMNMTLPAALVLLASAWSVAVAQEESEVVELRGGELTAESLVEALRPDGPPPPEFLGTRGGERDDAPIRMSCEQYDGPRSRGMEVKAPEKSVAVEVLFELDSAELQDRFTGTLDALGEALTSGALSPCCFRIEGHTDSLGTEAYNLELSRRRARTVVDFLTAKFSVDPSRLFLEGFGERRPIADNATSEGRQRNRRVQVVNLGYGEIR